MKKPMFILAGVGLLAWGLVRWGIDGNEIWNAFCMLSGVVFGAVGFLRSQNVIERKNGEIKKWKKRAAKAESGKKALQKKIDSINALRAAADADARWRSRYIAAIDECRERMERKDAELAAARARISELEKEKERLEAIVEQSKGTDSSQRSPLFKKAHGFVLRGEFDKALALLDVATLESLKDPRLWDLRAQLLYYKGDFAAAVESWGKLTERRKSAQNNEIKSA